MAKGSVFRRFLELVLDRESAAKTERDTQEALNNATNPKKPNKNLEKVGGKLDALGAIAKRVGVLIGSVFSSRAVLRATIEYEESVADVESALASTGMAAGRTRSQLLEMAEGLSDLSRFSDAQVRGGLARLLGYTDIQGDMFDRAAQAAVDMATRLRIDVASAAERVGNALNYPTEALNSLTRQGFRFTEQQKEQIRQFELSGDIASAQAIILGELELAYQGAARAGRDTLGGSLDYLRTQFTDGIRLGDEYAASLAKGFNAIGFEVGELREDFDEWMIEFDLGLLEMERSWVRSRSVMRGPFGIGRFPGADDAAARLEVLDAAIAARRRDLGIFRGDITDTYAEELEAKERLKAAEAEAAREAERRADKEREASAERLVLLTEGLKLGVLDAEQTAELWGEYENIRLSLQDGNLLLEERIRLTNDLNRILAATGHDGEPLLTARQARALPNVVRFQEWQKIRALEEERFSKDRTPAPLRRIGATPITGGPRMPAPSGPELNAFKEFFLLNMDEIKSASQVAALGMQSAFENAFLAINDKSEAFAEIEENRQRALANATTQEQRNKINELADLQRQEAENIAGFMETLGRGAAASTIGAIAQIAAVKVAENTAEALGAVAHGILERDPTKFAAAAKFMAAAAAWGAAGGLAGAAASGIRGGGSSFRGSDAIGRQVDKIDREGSVVNVYVDGVDPSNPRHQALVGRTVNQYSRAGGTVNYLPRGR